MPYMSSRKSTSLAGTDVSQSLGGASGLALEAKLVEVFSRFLHSHDCGTAPAESFAAAERIPAQGRDALIQSDAHLLYHQVTNALAFLGIFSSAEESTAQDQRIIMKLWPELSPQQDGRCRLPDFVRVVSDLFALGESHSLASARTASRASSRISPGRPYPEGRAGSTAASPSPSLPEAQRRISPPRRTIGLRVLSGAEVDQRHGQSQLPARHPKLVNVIDSGWREPIGERSPRKSEYVQEVRTLREALKVREDTEEAVLRSHSREQDAHGRRVLELEHEKRALQAERDAAQRHAQELDAEQMRTIREENDAQEAIERERSRLASALEEQQRVGMERERQAAEAERLRCASQDEALRLQQETRAAQSQAHSLARSIEREREENLQLQSRLSQMSATAVHTDALQREHDADKRERQRLEQNLAQERQERQRLQDELKQRATVPETPPAHRQQVAQLEAHLQTKNAQVDSLREELEMLRAHPPAKHMVRRTPVETSRSSPTPPARGGGRPHVITPWTQAHAPVWEEGKGKVMVGEGAGAGAVRRISPARQPPPAAAVQAAVQGVIQGMCQVPRTPLVPLPSPMNNQEYMQRNTVPQNMAMQQERCVGEKGAVLCKIFRNCVRCSGGPSAFQEGVFYTFPRLFV